MTKHAFLLAGTHSGCGKTTLSLALMAAFRSRGLTVQPFKVGPDFIDPGLHALVTGRSSRNLDGWMCSREYNESLFRSLLARSDLAIVEGVMGLFDGYDGLTESGSSAEMAKWQDIPVVLVVDVRSMARSVAALVQGYTRFDPDLRTAGVIFNRIGGEGHLAFLQEAMSASLPEIPVLGGIPRDEAVAIPERHLGLVTADELRLSEDWLDRLSGLATRHLDLDRLLEATVLGPSGPPPPSEALVAAAAHSHSESQLWMRPFAPGASNVTLPMPEPLEFAPESRIPAEEGGRGARMGRAGVRSAPLPVRVRIAVARDAAFCFYYPDNLDLLEEAGAGLELFSPLGGECVPPSACGVYLGGGYPEVFASELSTSSSFLESLRRAAASGMPIYAECGGLMALSRFIETTEGRRYPMAGLLPFGTRMLKRRKALGYTEVQLEAACHMGKKGLRIRGHEFHYSEIAEADAEEAEGSASVERVYRLEARKHREARLEGYRAGPVLASYVHLHWGSAPQAAHAFVQACLDYSRKR